MIIMITYYYYYHIVYDHYYHYDYHIYRCHEVDPWAPSRAEASWIYICI